MNADQQVIIAITVNITNRQRFLSGLGRWKSRLASRIGEFCEVGRRLFSWSMKRNEILRRKVEYRPPGNRALRPFHLIERCLIRRCDFHRAKKAIEYRPRVDEFSRSQ